MTFTSWLLVLFEARLSLNPVFCRMSWCSNGASILRPGRATILPFPGTFRLFPTAQSQLADLERDYQEMQVMLFGKAPDFGSLLDELRKLEADINSIGQKA